MSQSDHDLLQDYARDGSQAAFATLVGRHLNLVYSAARRQVHSPQLAEEVAQSVFLDLAQNARRFPSATPLVAWLHVVTRRTAIDLIRRESRRQSRENEAAQLSESDAMKTPSAAWTELEPLLDEAVESLNETDRAAILLRYFENKSLRDIGVALGASDDAAQKRVSRAVEQLRAFFLRSGVAVTAAGLTTELSAHALQAAPASLGAAISTATALSTSAAAGAALETTRFVAMTTLQKSLAVAAFVALGSAGLYETAFAARESRELSTLRDQTDRVSAEVRALRFDRDGAAARLKSVDQQIDARLAAPPASAADLALEAQMKTWFDRVDALKAFLARHPELDTPELQRLATEQWLTLAGSKPVDSDDAARQAIAQLRRVAESVFVRKISESLRDYLKANGDMLPARARDLAPFSNPPIDPAILDRYEVVHTGKASDVPPADKYKILVTKNPADPEYDSISYIGPNGYGNSSASGVNITEAVRRFKEANSGQSPATVEQVRPYLKWPMRDEPVQKYLDYDRARSRTP